MISPPFFTKRTSRDAEIWVLGSPVTSPLPQLAESMPKLATALKNRFLRFRREILVVAYAIRHPATPFRLRLAGLLLILYLASPIDLIPLTLLPLAGLLDDLIIVPWGLSAVVRRLPAAARTSAEADAARFIGRYVKRPFVFLAALLLLLALFWIGGLWLVWYFVLR